jgi:hypothetical protein
MLKVFGLPPISERRSDQPPADDAIILLYLAISIGPMAFILAKKIIIYSLSFFLTSVLPPTGLLLFCCGGSEDRGAV